MRHLRLSVEYFTAPIWEIFQDGGLDEVEPGNLPLSDELQRDLNNWAEDFHKTFNEEYPPDGGFATMQEAEAFEERGRVLWSRLNRELGSEFSLQSYGNYEHPFKRAVLAE